jgi:N-acetyl-beta-hexosaminidase
MSGWGCRFVHIGGDETDPQCWGASAIVRGWANEQGISLYQLQSHFNARIFATLKSMGKVRNRLFGRNIVRGNVDMPRQARDKQKKK